MPDVRKKSQNLFFKVIEEHKSKNMEGKGGLKVL